MFYSFVEEKWKNAQIIFCLWLQINATNYLPEAHKALNP